MRRRGELAYRVAGTGPPLLLLHGFTGSSTSFAHLLPALAEQTRVIAPDLLGHGESAAPVTPSAYALAAQARAVDAILAAERARPAVVLGYSLGGRLALELACQAPAAVRALVLVSAAGGLAGARERALRRAQDAALAERILARGVAAFADEWEAGPLFAGRRMAPELAAAEAAIRRRQRPEGLAGTLRGAGQGTAPPRWADLPRIDVPALVVYGEADERYASLCQRAAALLPRGRAVAVPGAGHTPHLEAPDVFLAILSEFLREVFPDDRVADGTPL